MNAPTDDGSNRSQASAALRRLLVALVKAALVSDPTLTARYRDDAAEAQRPVAGLGPSGVKLDGLWTRAVAEAEADRDVRRSEDANPTLPVTCPLALEDLTGPAFDPGAAASRIRETSSFG